MPKMRNFFTFKQHGKGLNITEGLLYVIFYRNFFYLLGFFPQKSQYMWKLKSVRGLMAGSPTEAYLKN